MWTWTIFALFVAAVLASLLLAHRASALSLPILEKTTSLVTRVLKDTTNTSITAPASQSNATTTNTSPQNRSTAPAVVSVQQPMGSRVSRVNPSSDSSVQPDRSLTAVTPLDTTWLTEPILANATSSQSARLPTVDQPTRPSATDTLPFLQPTEQGWSLFGILWYWWLLGLAAGGVSLYVLVRHTYQLNNPLSE